MSSATSGAPNERPRTLEQLIEAYQIDRLRSSGDQFVSPSGSLGHMPDGDICLGSLPYSSMLRLAQRWRFQEPTFRSLLTRVMAAFASEADLEREIQESGFADLSKPPVREPTISDLERFQEIGDWQGAHINTRGACGGAVMVMVASMLDRYSNDLGLAGPLSNHGPRNYAGHTFGGVVQAAANSFRHHDEWTRTRQPSERQASSMVPIMEVLNASTEPKPWGGNWLFAIRNNLCGEVLRTLSRGNLDILGRAVFDYATALAP